jgi:uncharacterized protein (DUF433 family)
MKDSLFEGIYDIPSAARYLKAARMANEMYPVTSRHLIRWIRNGLAHEALEKIPGREIVITFEDLISMRVVAALRAYGVSWPAIYRSETWLREFTGHARPFATDAIWTGKNEVFSRFKDMIINTSRHGQLAMDIIDEYLIPVSGLVFEQGVAAVWEPQKLVLLDPDIQFGAPCISGTRIPTRSVWGMLSAGDSPELVTRAYQITPEELEAARVWEEALAAAA